MKNNIIKEAQEKLYNSSISKYLNKDVIDNAIEKIYICESEEELYQKYQQITGFRYDGNLKGFNNHQISYIPNNSDVHTVIHEILHTLSSEFDENGKRTVNGIQGNTKEKNFGVFVNEGLTDYLASKISNKQVDIYKNEKVFFQEIEENMSNFFEDKDILFDIYLNKDISRLEGFVDTCIGTGSLKNIYDNYEFMNYDEITKLSHQINFNAKKIINVRNFSRKHPFLSKITNKFSKYGKIYTSLNTNKMALPSAQNECKESSTLTDELQSLTNSPENILAANIEDINSKPNIEKEPERY